MSVQPGGSSFWNQAACGMDPCDQLKAARALHDWYKQAKEEHGKPYADAWLAQLGNMSEDNLKDLIWRLKQECDSLDV